MKCSNCGAELGDGVKFCSECGAKIIGIRFCMACGAEADPSAKFCAQCGHRIEDVATATTGSAGEEKTQDSGWLAPIRESDIRVSLNDIESEAVVSACEKFEERTRCKFIVLRKDGKRFDKLVEQYFHEIKWSGNGVLDGFEVADAGLVLIENPGNFGLGQLLIVSRFGFLLIDTEPTPDDPPDANMYLPWKLFLKFPGRMGVRNYCLFDRNGYEGDASTEVAFKSIMAKGGSLHDYAMSYRNVGVSGTDISELMKEIRNALVK